MQLHAFYRSIRWYTGRLELQYVFYGTGINRLEVLHIKNKWPTRKTLRHDIQVGTHSKVCTGTNLHTAIIYHKEDPCRLHERSWCYIKSTLLNRAHTIFASRFCHANHLFQSHLRWDTSKEKVGFATFVETKKTWMMTANSTERIIARHQYRVYRSQ